MKQNNPKQIKAKQKNTKQKGTYRLCQFGLNGVCPIQAVNAVGSNSSDLGSGKTND